jgi:hypothetical protein
MERHVRMSDLLVCSKPMPHDAIRTAPLDGTAGGPVIAEPILAHHPSSG